MKIGYFVSHFPYIDHLNDADYDEKYAHGGTEIAAYNLAINIAKKYEVDVFTTSMTSKDSVDTSGNIKIYRYSTILKIVSANLTSGIICRYILSTFNYNGRSIWNSEFRGYGLWSTYCFNKTGWNSRCC